MKTLIHLKRYHRENGAKGSAAAGENLQRSQSRSPLTAKFAKRSRKDRKEKPPVKPRSRAPGRVQGVRLDAWGRVSAPATDGCVPATRQARTFLSAGRDPPAYPARKSLRGRRSELRESEEIAP